MRMKKSKLPENNTLSSTDKQAQPDDEIVVPSDENSSISNDTTQVADETVSLHENEPSANNENEAFPDNEDEIVSPFEDTVVSNEEATDSTVSGTISSEETVPSDTETVSTPEEPVIATPETASTSDPVVSYAKEASSSVETRQTWRAFVAPWWQATLAVLPTFLVTRFIFLLLSYFGGILFFVKNYAATVIPLHDIIYRWDYWDAKRFVTLATSGYVTPDYAAFFPLYPTIVHVLAALTHRDVLAVSMFVSNMATLGMFIVLYRFVTVEFDKEIARRTVLYMSIFPTALFFFAGYNESLFLFFTLLCFYALRRGSWWLAGFFGLLASLTRSSGIFLALVFVLEYLHQKWPVLREEWQQKELSHLWRPLVDLSAVLLIPLGVGIYAFGLYRRFHDPLAFVHAQSNWRQGLTFPLYAPWATFKKILTLPFFSFTTAHNIIDLGAAVLFTILLALCFVGPYRLRRSQWTFPLFGILILVTTMLYPNLPRQYGIYDPLASTQRLVLEAFVGFVILARLGRRPWFHQLYLLLSLPLLAFLTLQFMTGHWTV